MVHGVAAAHRGRLELRSAPGEGFTAILLLARGPEGQA
jgi:signal transduction histidine kinase